MSGNLLTFVAEDDVWLAPLDQALSAGTGSDGARAWRLTADRKPAAHPRLNPSGTHVAWSSSRDGAGDAYVVRVDGGAINRLTYWGKPLNLSHGVRGWLSDTEVIVTGYPDYFSPKKSWGYAVPLDGPARQLPYGPTAELSFSPEGAVLLNPICNREPAQWKRYGGGRGGQVWYSPDGTEFERILREVGNNLVNPMWVAGRVVFLSDHEGVGALYSALPNGTDIRRHTDHGPYYARHATTDGTRVVYQCAGDLWLLESLDADANAEPVKLNIRLGGVRTGRAPFPVAAESELKHFSADTTGRVLAVEVRGTAHRLPVVAGPAHSAQVKPGVRARLPLILPGTSTVVCVSDSDGEDGLDFAPEDGGETRRILSGELGRVLELAASPDGKTLAVASDDKRLLLVDVETGAATELATAEVVEIRDLNFSPDSAFLAWASPWTFRGDKEASHIRLARLADREIVDVTPQRFDDFTPVFTRDGKFLAFLSNRTHDPIYDAHMFDLGFLPGVRPYLVGLATDTPSPFGPQLNGRPAAQAEKPDKPDNKDKSDAKDETDAVEPVLIEFSGVQERIEPVPVPAGAYRDLRAAEDSLLWLDEPPRGELHELLAGGDEDPKPRLQSYDLRKRKLSTLVEALERFAVSGDGTRLVYRKGKELIVQAVADKDADEAITVDLDRIRVTVDPGAEWRQMYGENWRLMRDNYWRSDMGGVDWAAMGERYRPLLDRIGSTDDLHDLLWEVGGELGTSHAYVIAAAAPSDAARAQGLLGADLARDEEGGWRIARILPGENSVAGGRSPLRALGVAAREGDAITAVDGRPVDLVRGPNAALSGKAGKPVELTLRREGEPDRRVAVVPIGSENVLRYQDLVRTRRARVHELSDGRIGYVHVPDMQAPGWADFHRDLHSELGREGLVVDLRSNNGGHTSGLVIEKLTRKIIGWDAVAISPVSYPFDAPRGSLVAVTDECSGSDGDIATHAFKRYGLGPVVGTRTWGGVIGIDARYSLVDGTLTTQPKYAFWFDNGVGWGVENYGVDPDVEVVIAPQDWAAGRDPQLQEAVRLALEELERNPAATPPPLPTLPSA